jgi:hypothetical protein
MAVIVSQLPDGEELVRFVASSADASDRRRPGLDRAPDGWPVEARSTEESFWRSDERRLWTMRRYPQNDWEEPRRKVPEREREPQETPGPRQRRPNDRPATPDPDEETPAPRRTPRGEL